MVWVWVGMESGSLGMLCSVSGLDVDRWGPYKIAVAKATCHISFSLLLALLLERFFPGASTPVCFAFAMSLFFFFFFTTTDFSFRHLLMMSIIN